MKKKLLSLVLVLAMIAAMFAGCGKKDDAADGGKNNEPTKATTNDSASSDDAAGDDGAAEPTPTMVPNEVIGDTSVENPFYVYGWNTDVNNNVLKYFAQFYPEDAKRIIFVNTGGSNNYQTKIDALLQDPTNEQYPDMFAMEMDYIMKYTDSDYTIPVTECGITEDDLSEMYEYTIQAATVDGQIKGLSWQACPGAMMYRRSLAEKYLGVSEPEDVQEYFKDWDTMLETGKTILEKSGGATKLFSGVDDVKRVYQAGRTHAWYDENSKIVVDDVMLDYMDYAKQLYDLGLTNNTAQWSSEWTSNMATDNTFAYMGCTWFLHWTIKANCGGEKVGEGTYGDWAMCAGPQSYYWGGTWLGVSKECSDKELAGKILKALCNKDVMKAICEGSLDYVNNKSAIKELSAEGKGTYEFLGGQDFLSYFSPLAEAIKLPAMCGEDFYITNLFDAQVTEYVNGNKDKDTAVADFKRAVVDQYPYLSE